MATTQMSDREPGGAKRAAHQPMPHRSIRKFTAVWTCLTVTACLTSTSGNSQPELAGETVGSRHVFKADVASPYPAIGCWDHRALMFVVREMGDDAQAAQLFADRECRHLVPDAPYLKCGTGGLAHPLEAEPISYSAYCRLGVSEIKLYVLDRHMPPAPVPSTQAP